MGTVFSYSLYSSIVLLLLYLAYKWVLAGENQHTYNRVAIWLIYLISILALPAVSAIHLLHPLAPAGLPGIEIGEIGMEFVTAIDNVRPSHPIWLTVLLWIYLAGVFVALAQTVLSALRLSRIISQGEVIRRGHFKIVLTADNGIAPFSWWRYVVMSRKDWSESGELILLHEWQHLELRHWIDLLFAQLIGILQWYNPAAWLMRDELKTVHEYQADRAVLASGIPVRDYQMLLIKKAVGARFPSLANSLNHSKLKKRITMMYNQNSSAARRLRGLALVPALAAALAVTDIQAVASALDGVSATQLTVESQRITIVPAGSVSAVDSDDESVQSAESVISVHKDSEKPQNSQAAVSTVLSLSGPEIAMTDPGKSEKKPIELTNIGGDQYQITEKSDPYEGEIFTTVEKKPEFPGGDAALLKFVSDNLRYPKEAHEKNIQGRVIVRFVINKDGSVGATEVVRGTDPLLDAEAERVVKSLPKFHPGEINGQPVAVYYTLPITFRLSNNDHKSADGVSAQPVKMVDGRPVLVIDGKEVNPEIYLNDKLYEGKITDLDPSKIESITVKRDEPEKHSGVVYIKYKQSDK